MHVERLKAKDCKELTAFLDEVFTLQNGHQMDFANMFPRIFVESDEAMHWYYAVKEDGKIIGTAASHPLTYRVGTETLKVSGGGNVAVSPAHRNRGIMQALLHRINEDLKAEGFDLACLHGDRKRYRTFGFERCGIEYLMYFSPSMLALEKCEAVFTLSDLAQEPPQVLEKALAIANRQTSGYVRTDADFLPALHAHSSQSLVLKDSNQQVVGYLSLDVDGAYIAELGLRDADAFSGMLASVSAYLGNTKTIALRLPAYEHRLVSKAVTLCARYQIIQPGNFQIIRFDNVVRTFLKAKRLYTPIMDGCLTLDTEWFGKWAVSVENGQVNVLPYDGNCDIYLPGSKVYAFVFGPNAPYLADIDLSALPPQKALLVANWFPLPLYCPHLS